MSEQSVKLLYLGIATLLFAMALQSFYQKEKAFQSFFDARRAATETVSWWQEGVESELAIAHLPTSSIANGHEKKGTIFSGKELQQALVGLAIGLSKEYQPRLSLTDESTLKDLSFSENLLRKGVSIELDGHSMTEDNVIDLCEAIDETAYYTFSYDVLTEVYVINKL